MFPRFVLTLIRSPSPPPSKRVPRSRRDDLWSYGTGAPPRTPLRLAFVEDEAASLARELGGLAISQSSDDEIPSRGDINQEPVMVEVFEHNPERRFVFLPNPSQKSKPITEEDSSGSEKRRSGTREYTSERRFVFVPKPSQTSNTTSEDDKSGSNNRRKARQENDDDGAGITRKYEPVFDDQPDSASEHLKLDTDMREGRKPERQRARSSIGAKPREYSARPSAKASDELLSSEAIKHGSGRREKAYYGYGTPTDSGSRSHQRSYSNLAGEGRRDKDSRRESPGPSTRKRSDSNAESNRPRGLSTVSNGRPSESRYRESSRKDRRDTVSKPRSPTKRREESRSSDENGASFPRADRRRRNSTLVRQDQQPFLIPEKDRAGNSRTHSRPPPVPPHREPFSTPADAIAINPRSSVTLPSTNDERSSYIPYTNRDRSKDAYIPTATSKPASSQRPSTPSASMPSFPTRPAERIFELPTSAAYTTSGASWLVHSGRDDRPVDSEIGSYRRYFEESNGNGTPKLQQCRRTVPVAGKTDWLTLPRTDFNICPECFQGTFGNSEYRTLFHTMLRPTDKAISCEFGSGPWYRIAWLLTLKAKRQDLQLLNQVDNVAAASRGQPCPITRRAIRYWFTIRDPYTRRPVKDFTVCHQCAKTVESLLPNLMGIFVPLDSRSEPIQSVCSLHFTPHRKRFASYFDTLETASDRALRAKGPPDGSELALRLDKISSIPECCEDSAVADVKWHFMQFLPRFTVCQECFLEVVQPKLKDENILARNFYKDAQRLPLATCQLYSARMREVFGLACRRNDPKYLEAKVIERLEVEADIHGKLVTLDRMDYDQVWKEQQVGKLIREWERFE